MRPELNTVITFKNINIINRFSKENPNISIENCQKIFTETLKWLWLCNESYYDNVEKIFLFIYDDSLIIDKMWHNFILFTKEYQNFCLENFGRFIQHSPNNDEDENTDFDRDLSNMYSYIYDKLGEDTLNLWFREFPEKFNERISKNHN